MSTSGSLIAIDQSGFQTTFCALWYRNQTARVSLSVLAACQFFHWPSAPPAQWDHPSVVMVVYDVTSEQSFASCAKWLERVKVQRPGAEVPLPGEV